MLTESKKPITRRRFLRSALDFATGTTVAMFLNPLDALGANESAELTNLKRSLKDHYNAYKIQFPEQPLTDDELELITQYGLQTSELSANHHLLTSPIPLLAEYYSANPIVQKDSDTFIETTIIPAELSVIKKRFTRSADLIKQLPLPSSDPKATEEQRLPPILPPARNAYQEILYQVQCSERSKTILLNVIYRNKKNDPGVKKLISWIDNLVTGVKENKRFDYVNTHTEQWKQWSSLEKQDVHPFVIETFSKLRLTHPKLNLEETMMLIGGIQDSESGHEPNPVEAVNITSACTGLWQLNKGNVVEFARKLRVRPDLLILNTPQGVFNLQAIFQISDEELAYLKTFSELEDPRFIHARDDRGNVKKTGRVRLDEIKQKKDQDPRMSPRLNCLIAACCMLEDGLNPWEESYDSWKKTIIKTGPKQQTVENLGITYSDAFSGDLVTAYNQKIK